jgi:hypothetical protein
MYYRLGNMGSRLLWMVTTLSYTLRFLVFMIQEMLTGKAGYAAAYAELIGWITGSEEIRSSKPRPGAASGLDEG